MINARMLPKSMPAPMRKSQNHAHSGARRGAGCAAPGSIVPGMAIPPTDVEPLLEEAINRELRQVAQPSYHTPQSKTLSARWHHGILLRSQTYSLRRLRLDESAGVPALQRG